AFLPWPLSLGPGSLMDSYGSRALTTLLADDLGWLEQHCRQHPEQAVHTGQLRLAAALARNCVGPFLGDQPPAPLHVAVVGAPRRVAAGGGAGAARATVATMRGAPAAAGANRRPGSPPPPAASPSVTGPLPGPGQVGFRGTLHLPGGPGPASIDADVYQVRRV